MPPIPELGPPIDGGDGPPLGVVHRIPVWASVLAE